MESAQLRVGAEPVGGTEPGVGSCGSCNCVCPCTCGCPSCGCIPASDPNAPSVEECLRSVHADLYPWQIDRARQAFRMWLASWNGLGMKAEELVDRV